MACNLASATLFESLPDFIKYPFELEFFYSLNA